MQIREIMTAGVETVDRQATLMDAARKMKELDVGLVPVCDGGKLAGIVTDRDITIRGIAEGCDPEKTTVADVMSPEVVYCYEDQDVEEAASLMEAQQIRRLPIMSRDKRLVGIVSLGDLAVHTGNKALAGETLKEVSEPAAPKR
ncbi:MAG TPA: CBS domain-containing protein [Candidatus Acidoferrales bacterium]|nr:CBS domain-containing protein [Candidatus Acidoferrales bacterium]